MDLYTATTIPMTMMVMVMMLFPDPKVEVW